MSLQSIKDEIQKIESAIETVDPAAKAQIKTATAVIKAEADAIADSLAQHAEDAKAAVDKVLG